MHTLVYVFTGLVVAGSWWVAILVIGSLFRKLPEHWRDGSWRGGLVIVLGFLLAGACWVITAHLVERTFHVTILHHYDNE
jgi:hypothetical protein